MALSPIYSDVCRGEAGNVRWRAWKMWRAVGRVAGSLLSSDIILKHLAGVPVGIFAAVTPVTHFDSSSCEAETEYNNGVSFEKTTLQFRTTDEIPSSQDIAFVVKDVQGQSYLVGHRERPHPIVAVTAIIDKDTNIRKVNVSFSARKSLVPCAT